MSRFLLVCLAGALGTGARYLVGLGCVRAFGADFPYGTLAVNVVGCALMAAVMQAAASGELIGETTRYVVTTGFMGGLTTYSAFNYESTRYLDQRAWGLFVLNVGGTLLLCLLAGMGGAAVAKRALG